MNSRIAVGLMGGSFDPIHLGHVFIAEQARAALGLERVLFLQPEQDCMLYWNTLE